MITAYHHPDRATGRQLMEQLITSIGRGVPAALSEVITLGRTLTKRAGDVLAYFDHPGTSNGPTEAVNGPTRAPPWLSTRLPETSPTTSPDQYSRPRIQTPTTPAIVMSQIG